MSDSVVWEKINENYFSLLSDSFTKGVVNDNICHSLLMQYRILLKIFGQTSLGKQYRHR